jgi:hypothetical protein
MTAGEIRDLSMTVHTSLTRVEQAKVRAHLRALRTNLTQARDALMHFKGDRLDRDKLEPAARRVDDLMNLFAGDMPDSAQGPVWVAEIQSRVEQVTNPKVAEALRDARADITALLDVMGPQGGGAAVVPATRPGG